MIQKKINVLSGKIKSGKTTFLKNEIKNWNNVKGILQPVINGERFFYDIESGESIQITAKEMNEKTFKIGKYLFNNDAFEWAKTKLEIILNSNFELVVIDEYGPLEFESKGLEPIVSKIISGIMESENQKLVIVIRDSLVEKFRSKFNLSHSEVEIISHGIQ